MQAGKVCVTLPGIGAPLRMRNPAGRGSKVRRSPPSYGFHNAQLPACRAPRELRSAPARCPPFPLLAGACSPGRLGLQAAHARRACGALWSRCTLALYLSLTVPFAGLSRRRPLPPSSLHPACCFLASRPEGF